MNKSLTYISAILAAIIITWMLTRESIWFFLALYALLITSAGLLIFLIIAWQRISKTDKWSLGLSILAWLFVFYGIIHANGLTLTKTCRKAPGFIRRDIRYAELQDTQTPVRLFMV